MRLGLIIPEERKQREEVHSEIRGGETFSVLYVSSGHSGLRFDFTEAEGCDLQRVKPLNGHRGEKKGDKTNLVQKNLGHRGR